MASELHAVIRVQGGLTGDAAHLLAYEPGLADRILVIVENGGKLFCRRRFDRLLGDRDVIGEFGLTTKPAVRRVLLGFRGFVSWTRRRLQRS